MVTGELSFEEASFEYSPDAVRESRGQNWGEAVIGQPRALRAMAMGLTLPREGYNLFVSGDSGSGRLTAVRRMAEPLRKDISGLRDIVYTRNFAEPDSPAVLLFPPGRGRLFARRMDAFSRLPSASRKDEIARIAGDFPEAALFLRRISQDIAEGGGEPEKWRVNLLVDHAGDDRKPFIVETHPSYTNIFGSADRNQQFSHLAIHAGSLLKAAGGFLVLDADELMAEKGVWDALKKYLAAMADSPLPLGELQDSPIRPELPRLPVKVILIGTEDTYDALADKDGDFFSLFKVSAQFDYSMKATAENIGKTVALMDRYARDARLLPVTDDAMAQILRYSSWICESRSELSTSFSQLCDLLSEADYWARIDGKNAIDRAMIIKANDERSFALGLSEEKINEDIAAGEMVISLKGTKIGQVNGLAVMDRGASSFGTPAVITATVSPGTEGIVNIEHEAGLSGEIHDKGLLILQGYLRRHYARNFPLSIYAGIAFEQNYSEIDGDSASSTELYALLSAIGELPLRQDVAVTGSVNQMGMIQPVGGINEKIEGFFHACRITGLTGHQAVIIPAQNVSSLILPYEVLDAVKAHTFHICPVRTIDEGMAILTGRKYAQRSPKGTFPQGSYNYEVEEGLRRMYQATQQK